MKALILSASFLVPLALVTLGGTAVKVNHIRTDDSQQLRDIAMSYAVPWGFVGGSIGTAVTVLCFLSHRSQLSSTNQPHITAAHGTSYVSKTIK
ncbi:MAG: hypothetical protein U0105_04700 [Candidatus Obscuribacterales bacterium]